MLMLRRAATRLPRAQPALARPALARLAPRACALHATPLRQEGLFKHHYAADNMPDTPFEFDAESEKEIAFTLSKYPDTLQGRKSGIMPLLWIVQQQLDRAHVTIKTKNADPGAMDFPKSQGGGGWVPLNAMHQIAERLGCSHMDVYEVGPPRAPSLSRAPARCLPPRSRPQL